MQKVLFTLGLVLFLLGLFTGFAVPALKNPRMALSSHLEAVLNGMFLGHEPCRPTPGCVGTRPADGPDSKMATAGVQRRRGLLTTSTGRLLNLPG